MTKLREEDPSAVAVVDPYWSGEFELDRLTAVARRGVSGVIAYADFRDKPAGRHVAQLISIGIDHIVTLGVDDAPEALAEELDRACGSELLESLLRRVEDHVSWKQRLALKWALREGWRKTSVAMLAQGLNVDERTPRRWFADRDDLTPQRILSWGRILHASLFISQGLADPVPAANLFEFSGSSDLLRKYRRLTQRHLAADLFPEAFAIAANSLIELVRGEEAS